MLDTRNNIFTEVLVRNNRTTTDGFITDSILTGWYADANIWAASFHKWPFTEGRVETTFATGGGPNGDEYYFEGYKADSFRIVTVGGKRLTKLNFADYLILKEETPDASDKVFSDMGRTMFVNQAAGLGGTMVCYGQIQPTIDLTDESHRPVFTDWDREGNEAIVEKMSSYLKRREHLFTEAEAHDQRAALKLEEVWKRILDEQYAYQTTPERGGQYTWFPVVDEDSLGRGDRRYFKENKF
jgi:hypothetical protein